MLGRNVTFFKSEIINRYCRSLKSARKIAPPSNPNPNPNSNPKPKPKGAIFLWGNCPDTSIYNVEQHWKVVILTNLSLNAISDLTQFLATSGYLKMKENVLYFTKIKIEHISGSIVWNFIQFVFLVCQVKNQIEAADYFLLPQAFWRNTDRSWTSHPAWFLKKNIFFYLVIFYYLTNFIVWLPLRCIVIVS